jgi:hypothetical protein
VRVIDIRTADGRTYALELHNLPVGVPESRIEALVAHVAGQDNLISRWGFRDEKTGYLDPRRLRINFAPLPGRDSPHVARLRSYLLQKEGG